MDVYIVTGKLDGFHYKAEDTILNSSKAEKLALDYAVDLAGGAVSVGGTDLLYRLDSIIKVNTVSKKITEYELVLISGQFKLRELKNS